MKYCEHCGQKLLDEAIMCPACGKFVEKRQKVVHDNGEQTKPKTKKYDMLGVLSVIFIAIRYVLYAVVTVLFWFVVVVVGAGVGATTARISEVSLGFFLVGNSACLSYSVVYRSARESMQKAKNTYGVQDFNSCRLLCFFRDFLVASQRRRF